MGKGLMPNDATPQDYEMVIAALMKRDHSLTTQLMRAIRNAHPINAEHGPWNNLGWMVFDYDHRN